MQVRAGVKSLLVLTMAGVVVAATGSTAGAATGVDATPEKVVVDQSYENIPVRLGGVAANESCTVTLENYATRKYVDSDFLLDGVSSTTLKAYDWQITPGTHRLIAECTDYDTFTDTTVFDDIMIKFRGYVTNRATRSGSYVTITGKATRYSPLSLTDRSPVPATNLKLQKKVRGVWKTVKFPKTTSTGAYSIRIYSPAAAAWRVVLPETTKAWTAAGSPVVK